MFTEVRGASRASPLSHPPMPVRDARSPAVVSQADEKFRVDLCGILGTDDDSFDDMVKNGAGDEFDLQEVRQAGGAEALVRLARCRPPRRSAPARSSRARPRAPHPRSRRRSPNRRRRLR